MNGVGDAPPPAARRPSFPFREDCWTEEETAVLIEAWGERFLDLNRGNLRQKHWQEVADAVNVRHATGKRPGRTDIQCKNRVDTIKKKYKQEKARLAAGGGSRWRFFDRVDALIGPSGSPASGKKLAVAALSVSPPVAVPIHPRKAAVLPQALVGKPKRPVVGEAFMRGRFGGGLNGGMGVDSDSSRSSSESRGKQDAAGEEEDGFRQLAQAIGRFAEIYERVEEAKQKHMVELEKQRMEFAKELEYQRMQLFVDSQVNIEKMKRARRASGVTVMRPQFVLFGDSITEQSFRPGGWAAALADTYSRKADVVVRGYGGYNTRWALFMLNHLFPLAREFTTVPAAVTIFFGANDAALLGRKSEHQHVPVDEYRGNLKKIVTQLKNCSPKILIVLITPPPIDEGGRQEYAISLYGDKATKLPERTNEMAGVYAKACVEVAQELDISFINLWSKMQETCGWQKMYLSDGLHLTPEGNALVYGEVVRVFNEAGLSASDMPSDFPHHSEIDPSNPKDAFQRVTS